MGVMTGNQTYRGAVFVTGRASLESAGVLALLLGCWAGLVPFLGPAFGYSADGTSSWTWTAAHGWLFVLPGALCVLGAVSVLSGAGGVGGGVRSGGLLCVLAGAWLVVGPLAWPVLTGSSFFHGDATLTQLDYWIGYALGPGVLIACLGSFAIGRTRGAVASRGSVAPTP